MRECPFDMLADLHYALRGFRRSPAFTLVAILSLALGIGANTAIFSLVNAVMLRRMALPNVDRLFAFSFNAPSVFAIYPLERRVYREIRDRNHVFDNFGGVTFPSVTITGGGAAERLNGLLVTGNFFETLGVHAVVGRVLTPDDDRAPDSPAVCVLGYGLWQRRFGLDPSIVGREIRVNDRQFLILGVTPPDFLGLYQDSRLDIMFPLQAAGMSAYNNFPLVTFGVLKPRVTTAQAQASLDALYRQVAEVPRFRNQADVHVFLKPAMQAFTRLRGRYERPLLILMAVVALLLLIACANIANLLMARAAGRTREIAVRLALGASRRRLIQQLVLESGLLTAAGAVLGIAIAYWSDRALIAIASPQVSAFLTAVIDIDPDWRVLSFTLGVAALVTFIAGVAPAVQSTRPDLAPALKGDVGPRAPARLSFTNGLVVIQIALSLVLLIGAGLFLRSLRNLRSVDPGLDPRNLIVLNIDSGSAGYSIQASHDLFDRLVDRTRALPGVVAASPAFISPLSGQFAMTNFIVPGYRPSPGESDNINVNWIGADYFKALGTPMAAGRVFTGDDGRSNRVAIVNERAAARFWPGENPIGKHIATSRGEGDDFEVVGIVKDVRIDSLRDQPRAMLYLPFRQNTRPFLTLHVRVAGEPGPVIQALMREIHALDPKLPAFNVTTMAAQIDRTLQLDRLLTTLTAVFGFLGIMLATLGLYGVMAFAVTARTREIGIRMALGADRPKILRRVIGESVVLTMIGIGFGVPGAFWASRVAAAFLYRVSPASPVIYVVLSVTLAVIVIAAAWIPARRAARVDPMIALRYE
jgi:predicted permease